MTNTRNKISLPYDSRIGTGTTTQFNSILENGESTIIFDSIADAVSFITKNDDTITSELINKLTTISGLAVPPIPGKINYSNIPLYVPEPNYAYVLSEVRDQTNRKKILKWVLTDTYDTGGTAHDYNTYVPVFSYADDWTYQGTAKSKTPTFTGSGDTTSTKVYTIDNISPSTSHITINSSTGVVTANNTTTIGTYKVSVKLTYGTYSYRTYTLMVSGAPSNYLYSAMNGGNNWSDFSTWHSQPTTFATPPNSKYGPNQSGVPVGANYFEYDITTLNSSTFITIPVPSITLHGETPIYFFDDTKVNGGMEFIDSTPNLLELNPPIPTHGITLDPLINVHNLPYDVTLDNNNGKIYIYFSDMLRFTLNYFLDPPNTADGHYFNNNGVGPIADNNYYTYNIYLKAVTGDSHDPATITVSLRFYKHA